MSFVPEKKTLQSMSYGQSSCTSVVKPSNASYARVLFFDTLTAYSRSYHDNDRGICYQNWAVHITHRTSTYKLARFTMNTANVSTFGVAACSIGGHPHHSAADCRKIPEAPLILFCAGGRAIAPLDFSAFVRDFRVSHPAL